MRIWWPRFRAFVSVGSIDNHVRFLSNWSRGLVSTRCLLAQPDAQEGVE